MRGGQAVLLLLRRAAVLAALLLLLLVVPQTAAVDVAKATHQRRAKLHAESDLEVTEAEDMFASNAAASSSATSSSVGDTEEDSAEFSSAASEDALLRTATEAGADAEDDLVTSADMGVDLGADDISDFGKSDFDLTSVTRILSRMRYNVEQEQAAVSQEHAKAARICDQTIRHFTTQLDDWNNKIATARKKQLTLENDVAQLTDDIARYDRHINLKRKEVEKMTREMEIGRLRRLAAKHVYHQKANSTMTVYRALNAVKERLKQHIQRNGQQPMFNFKFREELLKANVDLGDATIKGMLGNALQIFGNGSISKDDVVNLHSMIGLLVTDIMDYKDDLDKSEKDAVTVWVARKQQINEQIGILNNDIGAKTRNRSLKAQHLLRTLESIRELKELQKSLPKKVNVFAAERATVSKKCNSDRLSSQHEVESLKKQSAALQVLGKVAQASNELRTRMSAPITRVELPVVVVQGGHRCTKLCTSDTFQACGLGCVSNKNVCAAKRTFSCTLTVKEWAQLQTK